MVSYEHAQDWHLASICMCAHMNMRTRAHRHTKDNCNRKRVIPAVWKGIVKRERMPGSVSGDCYSRRDNFRVYSVSAEICAENGFPLRAPDSQEGPVTKGCVICQWLRVGISFRTFGEKRDKSRVWEQGLCLTLSYLTQRNLQILSKPCAERDVLK